MYPFGQSISYWFHPLADNEAVTLASAMQTQTPAIYVYDAMPSRADAAAGDGSPVQTITSWTYYPGKSAFNFTIAAIDDPEPTSTVTERTYWVAINFLLTASEQSQLVLRALELQRVTGHTPPLEVTQEELKDIFPHVLSYSSEPQRLRYVEQATSRIKAKLTAKGFEWANLTRPQDLKDAVAYRAVQQLLLFLIQSGNDKFEKTYGEIKGEAQEILDGISLAYDADGDGQADTVAQTANYILVVR